MAPPRAVAADWSCWSWSCEPVKVNALTSPIWLKNGTTVSRTKRGRSRPPPARSARFLRESTTITGCWAAAKSPTTGITLITNGVCDLSKTDACWPLNSVTLGACSTLLRRSPWAALTRKKASMSLRIAKPKLATFGRLAELRHRQVEAVLAERNVQVGGEVRESDARRHRLGCKPDDVRSITRLVAVADRAWRGVLDVEVEVDADPLEEVVVERDEADFDRDLQVLHRRNCSSRSTISS